MARRRTSGVAVEIPEWVWAPDDTTNDGVMAWSVRVHDWAKENLYKREHFGLWMDVVRNSNHLPEHWRQQSSDV